MSDRRGFDWGPPTWSYSEKLKEWLVYPLLLALIGGGTWLLIDSAQSEGFRSSEPASDFPNKTGSLESLANTETNLAKLSTSATPLAGQASAQDGSPFARQSASMKGEKISGPTFMVQLGIYGDEESAKAAFLRLTGLGFSGSVALPDDQYEMYRLLMGPYSAEKEAEAMARRLNELDFPCFVIESP